MIIKNFITTATVLFILSSCASKYPTASISNYSGVPMTCVTDSTSLLLDTIVYLKMGEPDKTNKRPDVPIYKHMICDNKPDYLDFVYFYPSQILLDFDKKSYVFLFSAKPSHPNIKYGEKGFSVGYNFDLGTIEYSTKKHMITLKSTGNKWARTFKYSYDKHNKILTLKSEVAK